MYSLAPSSSKKRLTESERKTIEQIADICADLYGSVNQDLVPLFFDVADLYAGKWPSHEACEVKYHNFTHAIDVALALARMVAGWNRQHPDREIAAKLFLPAIAAALFHDAGYIKDKGDLDGHGGKFTLVHVKRSMELAAGYLRTQGWDDWAVDFVAKTISVTDYSRKIDPEELFDEIAERTLACMVATADLVSQMSDIDYLHRLKDLFAEFEEVYEFEDLKTLNEQGTYVFKSAREIEEKTLAFYENFVVPTLTRLGRMDLYLARYFENGRSPYQENITANLSSGLIGADTQWRRIGDILKELGLVDPENIRKALDLQQQQSRVSLEKPSRMDKKAGSGEILAWLKNPPNTCRKCLGSILLDMDSIKPDSLAKGLLAQILPDTVLRDLDLNELRFLVQTFFLMQNISKGPWVLGVVLEMINEILQCEASSVLMASPEEENLLISLPTGPQRENLRGKTLPVDKGLSGWVYRNGKSAMVANALADDRFHDGIDRQTGFTTRSILAVPLLVNGECLGVIESVNKINGNFNEHDLNLLVILSHIFAGVMGDILSRRMGC